MSRSGTTLVEVIVALVVGGLVVGMAVRAFLVLHRSHRALSERLVQDAAIRDAATALPLEFLELSSGDGLSGSDVIALTPTAVTFRGMRSFYLVCDASPLPASRVVLDGSEWFGLRALDAVRDSALIYLSTGSWVAVDPIGTAGGTCPEGGPGVEVTLGRPLSGVTRGAPMRGFETTEIRLYRSGDGTRWIGARTVRKDGGWGTTQPLLGPVGVGGMLLLGYGPTGAVTTDPSALGAIGIGITTAAGLARPVAVAFEVALRNAPP